MPRSPLAPLPWGLALFLLACGPTARDAQRQREESAKYHAELAYGYLMESGDITAALQEILQSLKLNERDASAQMTAGVIFMGRQDWLKALKYFKRALELQPDFHEAKNNLGSVYLALGQWSEAALVFEELTGELEYSSPALGYNNLGWALFQLRRLEEAKRALLTATQLDARLCPPHNNLGLIYLDLGDAEPAERSLRRALTQCPAYVEPHLHLSRLYLSVGDGERARPLLERCVQLGGEGELGVRCERLLAELAEGAEGAGEGEGE
jgi:type IV pilus assembly protein PilF